MTPTPPHKQLISLPLQTVIELVLRDSHHAPIDTDLAKLVYLLTKNEHTCYVQFEEIPNHPELSTPRLWILHEWRVSTERWLRDKQHSHERKIKEWIFEANVQKVSKALGKVAVGLQGDMGRAVAYQMVKRNDIEKMKSIGVSKLIEKEEELV